MSGSSQVQALCPRCYAELAPGARSCGRCGVALDDSLPGRSVAHGAFCPRCDRVEADGAGFTGVVGRGVAGSCEHCGTMLVDRPADAPAAGVGPVAYEYEEVSRSTDSWDLDRLIRAEAVDGWTLMDTTVDPAAPDRLLAHFRRALPAAATPASKELKAQAKAARLAAREAEKERREARRARPRHRPYQDRQMVPVVVAVGLVLLKDFAIPLLLALASVGREIFLSLLHAFLGPSLRRSQRHNGGNGRR